MGDAQTGPAVRGEPRCGPPSPWTVPLQDDGHGVPAAVGVLLTDTLKSMGAAADCVRVISMGRRPRRPEDNGYARRLHAPA